MPSAYISVISGRFIFPQIAQISQILPQIIFSKCHLGKSALSAGNLHKLYLNFFLEAEYNNSSDVANGIYQLKKVTAIHQKQRAWL